MQVANEEFTGVWHLRETRALLNWLNGRKSDLVAAADLNDWIGDQPAGP